MNKIDKWSILAGLRFALASIVALNHLAEYTNLGFLGFVPMFGAFEAVLGFLLISGYSVSVSYLKESDHFILRRFKRVYPIYVASIIVMLAVSVFVMREDFPSWPTLLVNLLFLNQVFTSTSYVGPAWSLSLEFWLYCLAPLLISRLRPGWNRIFVYVSFGTYLLYTACRTLFHLPSYSGVSYGGNLLFLSFVWICGLRLACEGQNRKSILRDIAIIFVGHLSILGVIQFLFRAKRHSISMFFREDLLLFAMQSLTLAAVLCIFAYYVVAPETGKRRSVLLRFLGDISYPLYLIHIPVFVALSKAGIKNAVAGYLIACAAAAALYWVVDVYSKRRHLQLPATHHAAPDGAAPIGAATQVQNLESSTVETVPASSAHV